MHKDVIRYIRFKNTHIPLNALIYCKSLLKPTACTSFLLVRKLLFLLLFFYVAQVNATMRKWTFSLSALCSARCVSPRPVYTPLYFSHCLEPSFYNPITILQGFYAKPNVQPDSVGHLHGFLLSFCIFVAVDHRAGVCRS